MDKDGDEDGGKDRMHIQMGVHTARFAAIKNVWGWRSTGYQSASGLGNACIMRLIMF